MKKIIALGVGMFTLISVQAAPLEKPIKLGTMDGPETQVAEVAAKVAAKEYGLPVKIITFTDYNMPNAALNQGDIDANAFQHKPFLDQQIKSRNYQLAVVGKTFVYPIGLYSRRLKNVNDIQNGAKIAIPNDPSNEARALLLLQKAGLITLAANATTNATPLDIVSNPKNLNIVELEAPQLPRSLNDVAAAVINNTFAGAAGLSLTKDAIYKEGPDSPYANLIVVRQKEANDPRFKQLVAAFHSPETVAAATKLFGEGAAISAQ